MNTLHYTMYTPNYTLDIVHAVNYIMASIYSGTGGGTHARITLHRNIFAGFIVVTEYIM